MLKKLNQSNFIDFAILFLLLSIPLNYAYSNIALVILVFGSFFFIKKNNLNFDYTLIFPILLFFVMLLSLFWTINLEMSSKAILKEISFFLIPISFILFGKLNENQVLRIVKYYTFGISIYAFVFLIIAFIKYLNTHNSSVFYYHELVSKDVNAIHFSVFVSMAFFSLLIKELKKWYDYLLLLFLAFVLFLLSSKTVIVVFILLVLIYEIFYSKTGQKLRLRNLVVFVTALLSIFFIGKVKERFTVEYTSNTTKSISHNVLEKPESSVNIISMKEAWNNQSFTPNDYLPGSAFRVYQTRVFCELMQENKVFFTGFGIGASQSKIEEKTLNYNLFQGNKNSEGYQKKNFHNQYLQIFSELGIFGFFIFITMLFYGYKNAINHQNFLYFAFISMTMIVFITESFLWRQRGVLFFITFYCLLNQINLKKMIKQQYLTKN